LPFGIMGKAEQLRLRLMPLRMERRRNFWSGNIFQGFGTNLSVGSQSQTLCNKTRFPMARIEIQQLSKVFQTQSGDRFTALKDVSLDIEDGEFMVVVGPSGCGKTTLVNLIAGLQRPSAGSIALGGKAILGPGRDRGVVFQQDSVFMWRTVIGNVEYGM